MRNQSYEDGGVKTTFSSEGAPIRGNGNVTTGSWCWLSQSQRSRYEKGQINQVCDREDGKRYGLNRILKMISEEEKERMEEMLEGQNKKVSKQAQCVGKSEMVITSNCSITSFVMDR